jgi:hypothetical protein
MQRFQEDERRAFQPFADGVRAMPTRDSQDARRDEVRAQIEARRAEMLKQIEEQRKQAEARQASLRKLGEERGPRRAS